MSATTGARILPRLPFGAARRPDDRAHLFMNYRRTPVVLLSGFFEPLFYLLGIGFGLGALIGDVPGPAASRSRTASSSRRACSATSAMNGAVYESTFNVFFKLRYDKTYDAILVDADERRRHRGRRDRLGRSSAARCTRSGSSPSSSCSA